MPCCFSVSPISSPMTSVSCCSSSCSRSFCSSGLSSSSGPLISVGRSGRLQFLCLYTEIPPFGRPVMLVRLARMWATSVYSLILACPVCSSHVSENMYMSGLCPCFVAALMCLMDPCMLLRFLYSMVTVVLISSCSFSSCSSLCVSFFLSSCSFRWGFPCSLFLFVPGSISSL